jgi:hypothetical protein
MDGVMRQEKEREGGEKGEDARKRRGGEERKGESRKHEKRGRRVYILFSGLSEWFLLHSHGVVSKSLSSGSSKSPNISCVILSLFHLWKFHVGLFQTLQFIVFHIDVLHLSNRSSVLVFLSFLSFYTISFAIFIPD